MSCERIGKKSAEVCDIKRACATVRQRRSRASQSWQNERCQFSENWISTNHKCQGKSVENNMKTSRLSKQNSTSEKVWRFCNNLKWNLGENSQQNSENSNLEWDCKKIPNEETPLPIEKLTIKSKKVDKLRKTEIPSAKKLWPRWYLHPDARSTQAHKAVAINTTSPNDPQLWLNWSHCHLVRVANNTTKKVGRP